MRHNEALFSPSVINCRGQLLDLSRPRVMGILNINPDSFYDGGRYLSPDAALRRTEQMLLEGADIIDIGGYSSRPGAIDISPEEELNRIYKVTQEILKRFPEAIISIDSFRSEVIAPLLALGIHMVNDISAGSLDPQMMETVASYQAAYIMMHMQGRPQDMQDNPTYQDVVQEVYAYFVQKINQARAAGINDLILDPGFGFGKNIAHNYELLKQLGEFDVLALPLLVGISRKSMIYRPVDAAPEEVLHLTSALHLRCLQQGARILRVHDVKEAVQLCRLWAYIK